MALNTDMNDVDPQIPENAVSIYGQNNALDDFPVLKAFQQYVDAEQNKARKRMVMLCAFFMTLMIAVIGVFVAMLMMISARNQSLNDRMIELAMKDRDRGSSGSAVVVQPPQDSAAIIALTAKLDEMQKKLADSQAQAEKAAAVEAAKAAEAEKAAQREAAKPKGPTAADLEIANLKALLAAEKEKNSLERIRQREAELEAYRRKHYPELYQPKQSTKDADVVKKPVVVEEDEEVVDEADDADIDEIDDLLKDYKSLRRKNEKKEAAVQKPQESSTPSPKAQVPSPKAESQKEYSIPVDVKGSSSSWIIPTDD